MLARGVIVRPMVHDAIARSPPLILTKADADEIVGRFVETLGAMDDVMQKAETGA